jgi:single-stranded-DNA-specific exonuclease
MSSLVKNYLNLNKPQSQLFNKSCLGLVWQQKKIDSRLVLAIKQKLNFSEVISKIIALKVISGEIGSKGSETTKNESISIDIEEIDNFLNPTIKSNLPNPFDLIDMNLAVNKVITTIKDNKKITLFADYDVDGATSAAILKRFFDNIGIRVNIYIPDRIDEGYGPNTTALIKLKNSGSDLVITLDCGATAFKPLEAARDAGLEIIVIDHHLGVVEKPAAIAVINPNRIDENFAHKNICAAAVSFLFVVALNKSLRDQNYYKENNILEPKLLDLLDLVALGTVCDVMPLTGLNRTLVLQGLKVLKKRGNLGLRILADNAGINEEIGTYHLGFILGPRINAGGRVGKSDLGATILSTNCVETATKIAADLEIFNQQRKDIESLVLEEAINMVEKDDNGFGKSSQVIFAIGNNWHAGVIGIVASRLKDLYNKPVAVITLLNDPKKGLIGKASCRSIYGVDFGAAILNVRLKGLLLEGGGHAMAAGFSVEEKMIGDLHNYFLENLGPKVEENSQNKIVEFLDILDLENINLELLSEISKIEPFGVGNQRPRFIIRNLYKIKANIVGKNHISCIFAGKNAIGFTGNLKAIAFGGRSNSSNDNQINNPLTDILLNSNSNGPFNVAGYLSINNWMGSQNVQLIIEDVLV